MNHVPVKLYFPHVNPCNLTCKLWVIYAGEDNDSKVQAIITRLIWITWNSLSVKLNHSFMWIPQVLTYDMSILVQVNWPGNKPSPEPDLTKIFGARMRPQDHDELIKVNDMSLWRHQVTLRWRHNGRDCVSNHQPHNCLLNRLFERRSK